MVATFPEPDCQRTNLFAYLKPCPPAPGIAISAEQSVREALVTDPFDRPSHLSKRRRRALSFVCGALQVTAMGLGLWAPSLRTTLNVEQAAPISSDTRLWNTLASDELAEVLLAAKEKQVNENLAEAEQARLQAQQLRLDAERQAQNLTEYASDRARKMTVEAMRQSDLIHVDTSFIGAEQVIYGEKGDNVTLKFMARTQCKEGALGETAIATPVDPRIVRREVRNLAVCYSNAKTLPGEPIGQVGEWGVAFFKME